MPERAWLERRALSPVGDSLAPGTEHLVMSGWCRQRRLVRATPGRRPNSIDSWKGQGLVDKILLTPLEAATALGISRSKLYELLGSGRLRSIRIGSCRRVPAEDLEAFVLALRQDEPGPASPLRVSA